ncbi:MAG TPA: hypothetical protein DD811_08035 [Syntrophomonas sp.]|jgi:hypothetical protein|nr:hypothetical protein [Syntrophomonas sp.]
MNYFVKLNIFGILYAFTLAIQTELMGNVYRISRLTNMPINAVEVKIGLMMLFVFIISTITFLLISSRYFYKGRLRYFLTILWIPYFLAFIFLFSSLIPMANIDEPPPVLGLILLGIYLAYPFYIAFINFVSTKNISE